MNLSVIVCAYTAERWRHLVAAIASIQEQTEPAREIIVVIDHNPALYKRAQAHFGSGITIVENKHEQGLAGARNCGVGNASGEIVVFLDDDAVAEPTWLARLTAHYRDPAVLGVGGSIEPQWEESEPRWFPPEFYWVVGSSYKGLPQTAAPVRNLIGANMSFRRSVFASVGGFRHNMGRIGTVPLGCEETELSIRVRQQWPGVQLLYEPAARVRHWVPAVRTNWRYFQARCYGEGQSKAMVTSLVGSGDGLSSERSYTLRTLPRGVAQAVLEAARQRDPALAARAGAIVLGLGITAFGYLSTRLKLRVARLGQCDSILLAPTERLN